MNDIWLGNLSIRIKTRNPHGLMFMFAKTSVIHDYASTSRSDEKVKCSIIDYCKLNSRKNKHSKPGSLLQYDYVRNYGKSVYFMQGRPIVQKTVIDSRDFY